jgi:D-glycero-D-manno-heptose 1,7-bisphosphate phosphatase
MNRAAFLDRDGVINQKAPEGDYITRWEDVKFLPGVAEAIVKLNRAGWQVIIITNQRCVAKGLVSIPELEMLHERMRAWLFERGAVINAVYYCPHEKTQPPCSCRKPEPGMLIQAVREHLIDMDGSWMIGDSVSDIEAGRRAGCKTVRIQPANKEADQTADIRATSLLEAVSRIIQMQETSSALYL